MDYVEDENAGLSPANRFINKTLFNAACDAILAEDVSTKIIGRVMTEAAFSAHFIQDRLSISTSFDHKYDYARGKWETSLHFRGIRQDGTAKKNKFVNANKYQFKGLSDLLENHLLPLFIDSGMISERVILDKTTSDEVTIKSSIPDDILRLNILLLDILDYEKGVVTANENRIERWMTIERITLPTIQSFLKSSPKEKKRSHRAEKSAKPFSEPGPS